MTIYNGYLAAIKQAELSESMEKQQTEKSLIDDWESKLVLSKTGKLDSRQYNYSLIMSHDDNLQGHFELDTFKHQITLHGELPFGSYNHTSLDDVIFTKLLNYLGATYSIDNDKMTHRALNEVADANRYDSLIKMLDALVWDETPRIETMFSILLGAEDSDYTREVAKLLMRGAVCRAYTADGIQFDIMPILVGKQGCRKTSFCRNLALYPEYFEDNLGDLGKADAARKLQGRLVVEMAELASITRSKEDSVRAFITRIYDSYRPLYSDNVNQFPRRCIFIGTTNDCHFLNESFWERRYLPIECGVYETTFDWTDINQVQYFFKQVWAEAIAWYKNNPTEIIHTLTPTPKILEENKVQQNRFRMENPWEAPIREYLANNEDHKICAKELLVNALNVIGVKDKPDQKDVNNVHSLMHYRFPEWKQVEKTERLGEWGPQTRYYIHCDSC